TNDDNSSVNPMKWALSGGLCQRMSEIVRVSDPTPKPGVGGSSPSTPARRSSARSPKSRQRNGLWPHPEMAASKLYGEDQSVLIRGGGGRRGAEGHVAEPARVRRHHCHGLRDGGHRLRILPGGRPGHAYVHNPRSRHRRLKEPAERKGSNGETAKTISIYIAK